MIVNEFFPPTITGGTEIFLEGLARYLKGRGHEITVLTTDQGHANNKEFRVYKIRSSPFHISHRYQFSGFTLPWLFFNHPLRKKISKIYSQENPDILHLNNLFHLSFSPVQGIPFLLDVHDYWPVCFTKDLYYRGGYCDSQSSLKCATCLARKSRFPFYCLSSPLLKAERLLTRKRLSGAREIVCHSDFVRRELSKQGLPSAVVPYPYTGPSVSPKKKSQHLSRILFIGRLEERKGADIILNVARSLDLRIDVIGEGPLKQKLDRPDLNIHVHGFLGEERYEYFKNADVLLAPSKWPEPFGIVALEAMAFRLPIITLEGSGLSELVERTGSGLVVREPDVSEAVLKLKNTSLINRIRNNQGKSINNFNGEKIYRKYEIMFERLI